MQSTSLSPALVSTWLLVGLLTLGDALDSRAATDWQEYDVSALRHAQQSGEVSAEELTRYFLNRIDQIDPKLNSVLAIDPTALDQARALDQALASGQAAGPLHGIPVLIKDNIETKDQPTTAGSVLLADNHTERDAPLVAALRRAGAVILGKTNLSEWANFRGNNSSSGWSSLGGQTRNPYDLTRTPCGSSSGSGSAVAAGLAPIAIGTETNGSIVCPAAANGTVGIKPSVGLISRTHIVPISHSQDTAGPMARTVADAAVALAAMMEEDPADSATAPRPDWTGDALVSALETASLQGVRIGVMRGLSSFHPEVLTVYDQAIEQLKSAGAVVVDDINFSWPDGFWTDAYTVLTHEFLDSLNGYLASIPDPALNRLDLEALIKLNQERSDKILVWFGQEHFEASAASGGTAGEDYLSALARVRDATGAQGIDRLIEEHDLDLLISPTGGPAWKIDWINGDHFGGGSAGLAAISGYPSITVPTGMVHGLPVGLSFFAGRFSEPALVSATRAFEMQRGPLPRPTLEPAHAP